MTRLLSGGGARVVHCSGCGLILGKDSPQDICTCPRCGRPLRVRVLDLRSGRDRFEHFSLGEVRRRFVGLWTSESMIRFLLGGQTARPIAWEPLVIELEQERLKAFTKGLGWTIAGLYRDPGAHVVERKRPFERLEKDLQDRIVNAVLVSDTARVSRKDLLRLWDLTESRGAIIVTTVPHPPDENLAFDEVDYHRVPDAMAEHRPLEAMWGGPTSGALSKLCATIGWHWPEYAADILASAMGPERFRRWAESDPMCRSRGWRTVLTEHAIARARRNGDLEKVPLPELRTCVRCNRCYLDAATPVELLELLATRRDYCATCLRRAFFHDLRGAEVTAARQLRAALTVYFRSLDTHRVEQFIDRVLGRRQTVDDQGVEFSPSSVWLESLRDVGELAEFGEVTIADGYYRAADDHVLMTMGAALLDNWLAHSGIEHRREVRYPVDAELNPTSGLRADFAVGDTLVEFVGLFGVEERRRDMSKRQTVAARAGVRLVLFHAEELLQPESLALKVRALADPSAAQ